jgi:hypothetical protein
MSSYDQQFKLDDAKRTLYARLLNKPTELLEESEIKIMFELSLDEAIQSTIRNAFYHDNER